MAQATTSVVKHFVRVSEEMPCPICGHDTWCLIAKDGKKVICPRVESQRSRGELGYEHPYDGKPIPKRLVEESYKQIDPQTIGELARLWYMRGAGRRNRLAHELGVTPTAMDRLFVGWSGSAYTFPMVNGASVCGIRMRGENGKKWSFKGGSAGLFVPAGVGFESMLFLVEGPTDTAALNDWGLHVVGRPNATACRDLAIKYAKACGATNVIVVADNDKAGDGERGAMKLRDEMPLPCKVVKPVRHKDARACYNKGVDRRFLIDAAYGESNREWTIC